MGESGKDPKHQSTIRCETMS